jgi:hypothetical protein
MITQRVPIRRFADSPFTVGPFDVVLLAWAAVLLRHTDPLGTTNVVCGHAIRMT